MLSTKNRKIIMADLTDSRANIIEIIPLIICIDDGVRIQQMHRRISSDIHRPFTVDLI